MARISTYPIVSIPTLNDLLIGTDVENLNETKNFSLGDISGLIGQGFVPYVGATGNVNLGAFNITAASFIIPGGLASQFVKANGTLDSTAYTPQTRTLTINGVTYNLSANRSWDLNTVDTLTTIGTSGAATYIGKTLNIPQYQAQGAYITQLSGEATAVGPGNATVTLDNAAVIGKVLTGLNVTGGTVVSTDTILQAFGKVQNQINGLAGGVEYQGVWNAATNTPFLQSSVGVQGYYYVVNVAGNTNLNGITDWQVGDWAIFNGSTWDKVDNTDAVVSVNGYVGAVVLTASDVGAVPTTRTLTINGVGYNLSADRSWTVGDVRTDQTYANPSWITSLAWTKITGTPTTLAGYGITDGALNTTTLTINGVTFDLTANRTWNVGTVTSIATTGPITGGTITGSGTIGITQAGASSDGYLSSTDWNTFNSKQAAISVTAPLTFVAGVVGITQSGALTDGYLSSVDWNTFNSKVSGSGTPNTLPMWGSSTSLVNSPLSYAADTFNFQYNSATGGTVVFTNSNGTAYAYTIQMNNFGSPRSTIHGYTDGLVIQSIGGTQVSRIFANGNMILGTGTVETGHKLTISGDLFVNTIINAVLDTDRFIVSDGGIIKYRTGAEVLADIGAQGSLTLTTTGTSGASTLIGNTLNIPQYTDQFVGTVTSVGLSMPSAFNVSNSPITSSGTIAVTAAGTASQYVRGDGTLADFPSGGGGGGSSVSYYLNGSVNQGTFVGNTYYEMSKTPIFGAGTDFSIAANGYVAQFITDAGDPNSLIIPAGNWNFETYFSASSAGGTPSFYVELYKYDGSTFTLIASNSTNPELIAFGTTVNPYFSALAVPETILTVTDRIAIRIYVVTSGRIITLHTENSNLCQIVTTFTRGLTALNGLTAQVQYFQVGTSGTDFNIASATATHTFNLPTASATNRGALSSADWSTFNSKQNAITLTTTGTSGPATFIGDVLNVPNYTTDLSGYVTLATNQTITGLKTILRSGDVLNFKIGTDTLYGLKVAYNQNELAPSGEATWSFVNTFNNGSGTGLDTTPISFFRGVLVTGQRLVSASVNTNLLDYYGNNPSGRYPIYAYNTGVQQFASSIIVGETTGVVNAITGAISDLPAGVVANFKGRVIGSNAVNSNEFVTLSQLTSGYVTAVTASSPLASSGGTTPNITIQQANGSQSGFLSSTDWTTFNSKQNALTNPVTGTGAAGQIAYFTSTSAITSESGLTWDATNNNLSIGGATANSNLTVSGSDNTDIFTVLSGANSRLHVGTVTSPSISTYIRSQNNYALNLGTNSTNYLTILSSGNVGVNTATPATAFEVNGVGLFTGSSLSGNTKNGVYIYDQAILSLAGTGPRDLTIQGQNLTFYTGTTYGIKMQIFSDGNLLIQDGGTFTNNGAKLQVTGTATISGSVTALSLVKTGGTSSQFLMADGSVNTNVLPSGAYLPLTGGILTGTTRMDGSGGTVPSITMIFNSGINRLLAPVLRLYGATNEASNYIELFGSLATSNRAINFPDASGTVALTSNIPANPVGGTGTSGTIPVFTGSTTIGNSSIFDNGTRVGVGTNSPSNKLDVLGSAASPNLVGTNAYARFYQSGGYANVTIGALASGSFAGWIQTSDGVGTALALSLQPSGGNLLVGTTTDNGARLQVSGAATFSSTIQATSQVRIERAATTNGNGLVWSTSGTADWYLGSSPLGNATSDLSLYSYGTNSVVLNIVRSTGAATFSSSVTANNYVASGGSNTTVFNSTGATTGWVQIAMNNTSGSALLGIEGTTAGTLATGSIAYASVLRNYTNTAFQIATNNIVRATITSGGNVLIGTTTDSGYKLFVNGMSYLDGYNYASSIQYTRPVSDTVNPAGGNGVLIFSGGQAAMRMDSAYTMHFDVFNGGNSHSAFQIRQNGNTVSINSPNNSLPLELKFQNVASGYLGAISSALYAYSVNGGYVLLNSSSAWVPASDIKRKRNFEPYTKGLSAILGLQPKLYNMDFQQDGDEKQVGLVAQEVKEFIPLAYEENADFIGINYNAVIVTIVKAIQEQQQQIQELKNKLS